jgi:oligopeptide transport system ATP-binding protein
MLLEVDDLWKRYPSDRGRKEVVAVAGVSFALRAGRTLGIVGESGSGKSTLIRCILRLVDPDSGRILLDGEDIAHIPLRRLRPFRSRMQMVFQNPHTSVNPRMTAFQVVEEPLILEGGMTRDARREAVFHLFERVRLSPRLANRHPHKLSGGQLQRVGIARAIACKPDLIVLDEPTASLDVSVRGGILALLQDIQSRYGTSFVFVSHDLQTVKHFSDELAIMYRGRFVEFGGTEAIYQQPSHEYTKRLLDAMLEVPE